MTKLPSQYKFQKSVWMLSIGCFLMFISYLSLIGKTITNVLERQNNEREISSITGNVSKVEFSYLNQKSSINASVARDLGFVQVEKTSVAKQKTVGNLSLNEI